MWGQIIHGPSHLKLSLVYLIRREATGLSLIRDPSLGSGEVLSTAGIDGNPVRCRLTRLQSPGCSGSSVGVRADPQRPGGGAAET
ncbi:hypothetical protein OJAV_G00221750 [Oryzias javanicus]|uniref:Uncharacterized protein n=1 Tax=Oryzias javanicus TaxID=123683 RepID=A0A437C289_ORYJA|nr:hypothetical protein OJAV_G00221750 [Oryzias javanicus]